MAVVADERLGFCKVELNELGPVQEYKLPPVDDKVIVPPTQAAVPVAVGVGIEFTVAVALFLVVETHPFKLHPK
jgi:hypothetical protein